ncbi:peptidoglycan editing factor PgeF [Trichlorobacter ammonificans]|uniref:Purine nucleoside phosphorylase n=1 Tax=Trichlorobacter ammonificans TaxID=2916410 RepID=A0ABN8HL14_9BACT|nr:peptidoglycan editing factor PgeF [Trichlorobacter ammonificans]CAH2032273.1 Purine nucleoside phosphorylase [Trichlorobacter ammonificans]
MEIIRSGRVHYLAPQLDTAAAATAVMGFSTRHEGVSRPPYNSLNLGTNTDDSPHNVEGNRSILARTFGLTQDRLVTVRQNHGNDILVIDAPNDDLAHFLEIEADAIITNQPGIMIGVTVADCVPVLLLDPVKRVIGAVHAGWQGTAAQIALQAVQGMVRLFDSRPADIRAAIGPCIGPCCYEVDQPVREGFAANDVSPWDAVAESRAPGKWQLDMALANRMQLEAAGVAGTSIKTASQCVCCHKELYFSYRRDAGETGRQMGFITLKEA